MDKMNGNDLLGELDKRLRDKKKTLHEMLMMNEKIEKLNVKLTESERVKTDFLSNIRNEINNPLTSILGIASELAGPVTDERTRQLMAQMIYNEAFNLDFQLRNIFIAAELEAGEAALSVSRVDVSALIKNLIRSFSHKAQEKRVAVKFICCNERQGEQALVFITDTEKLHFIIANLLANSIEYNHTGKKVTIEARKESDCLRVSVADEGIGIPEQERERLFDRFHQLDQGSSKKHKGHGLGLSIAKALVEMLGGTISVTPAPGGGSMFQISIPEAAAPTGDVFSGDGNEFLFENGSIL